MKKKHFALQLLALWLLGISQATAQWLTQTVHLSSGWNAVYFHVDASYDTLNSLVGADPNNPILEIWLWRTATSTAQFTTSPDQPAEGSSHWLCWSRNNPSSELQRMVGNAAYMVRVATNVSSYDWQLKGKVVGPNYQWTISGLNFIGFPTVPGSPPDLYSFLSPVPSFRQKATIYAYVGGELGPSNPVQVTAPRLTLVQRGQAFWVRAGDEYNNYFAPFEVKLSGNTGLDFGDSKTSVSFRLKNLTPGPLAVNMRLSASESVPSGQTALVGVPSLVIRGPMNTTNMTYGFSVLGTDSSFSWLLPASGQSGSEVEVVLGLDRSAMPGTIGDLLAGVLRFTDGLHLAQIDVPVSATKDSTAGLWVGAASVSKAQEYLKTYVGDGDGGVLTDANGKYMIGSINTNMGTVAQAFPLRLIVHSPESGNPRLLQRVYWGLDSNTNSIIALRQTALDSRFIDQARRISAVHLPWTQANNGWSFSGPFQLQNAIQVVVTEDYNNRASNPFLHEYHPDHDNLDAGFHNVLPQGAESYKIIRTITLTPSQSRDDFASVTAVGQSISGLYKETVVIEGLARPGGHDQKEFVVQGAFTLNRISEIPTLSTTP